MQTPTRTATSIFPKRSHYKRNKTPKTHSTKVAKWAPPLIAEEIHCGDYDLDSQSFIGSRIAENKRSFSAMGVEEYAGTRQQYHFDTTRLTANNTYAGLLGGFMYGQRSLSVSPFLLPFFLCSLILMLERRTALRKVVLAAPSTARQSEREREGRY